MLPMEEDENKVWLSSLGVTTANPEDIERDVLAEANTNVGNNSELERNAGEEPSKKSESIEPSFTNEAKILTKLRAVEFEIDAVASTVEQTRDTATNGKNKTEKGGEDDEHSVQASHNDFTLQHALASDRLRSLEKTKAQLEKEFSGLYGGSTSKGIEHEKVLHDLVKEDPRPKRKLKEVHKPNKNKEKKKTKVSFDDDVDFDSVLDAASAGFVETERDELVRKGILTPFHKLEGYERRLQQPGSSSRSNVPKEEEEIDNLASASIAKAVQSMSGASHARAKTKLLDSDALPKLDAPTLPFQRLRKPLKIPHSPDSGEEKSKGSKTRKKRPLPGKKWRKQISREENSVEGSGTIMSFLTLRYQSIHAVIGFFSFRLFNSNSLSSTLKTIKQVIALFFLPIDINFISASVFLPRNMLTSSLSAIKS